MKKLIVVFIALAMLFTCGCGAQKAEPTPEPSVEPTPEPTPVTISMDCAITDVLDADQQAFLSTLRSDPPAAAVVYLDGKYPETVILDLDTVRSICSAVSSLRVVSFAWAGFGATFGPIMIFALFWKRTNKYGAIAGMISGAVMIFVWKFLVAPLGGVFAIYELLPAFIISCVFIVVVSLVTAAPEKAIVEEFESIA